MAAHRGAWTMKAHDWNGGRGVYFRDYDRHVFELMTAQ
jgi:hypothetical protein